MQTAEYVICHKSRAGISVQHPSAHLYMQNVQFHANSHIREQALPPPLKKKEKRKKKEKEREREEEEGREEARRKGYVQ